MQKVLSVVFTSDAPNLEELIKRATEINRPEDKIANLSRYEKRRLVVQVLIAFSRIELSLVCVVCAQLSF